MDGDVEPGRNVAAPLVIARDPVRITGLDAAEQVAAHQVAAVVSLAESLEFTIGQDNRAQQVEQGLSLLHDLHRLRHDRVPLLMQGSPSLATLVDLDLIPDDRTQNHGGGDETRNKKPAAGHARSLTHSAHAASPDVVTSRRLLSHHGMRLEASLTRAPLPPTDNLLECEKRRTVPA